MLVVHMLGVDSTPPENLLEVHLVLDVAGLREFWRFEASQGLQHTLVWNRTDGYNRTLYGSAPAKGMLLFSIDV